jgi:steroid 5-alpha reductase family enzyme
MKNIKRFPSLLICLSGYLFSFITVILLYRLTGWPRALLAATFVYDLAATILIFIFSAAFNNSSFYDPYWSVAPVPIILAWSFNAGVPGGNPLRQWIILTLVFIWSVRLTFNWVRRWKGLNHEDWRYAGYRSYPRHIYWSISLVGFHIFPTLIVFAGCLSVYPAICNLPLPLGITDAVALVVCLSGIFLEAFADRQLQHYLRRMQDTPFLAAGLWKYSRHPNYFGEILFWTGLFAFSLPMKPFAWYTVAGPAGIILMFSLISVPMMDRRMTERKPGYGGYARKTSGLVPWKRK